MRMSQGQVVNTLLRHAHAQRVGLFMKHIPKDFSVEFKGPDGAARTLRIVDEDDSFRFIIIRNGKPVVFFEEESPDSEEFRMFGLGADSVHSREILEHPRLGSHAPADTGSADTPHQLPLFATEGPDDDLGKC